MGDQRAYWDQVASEKTFTHPLSKDWLSKTISFDARILDYGCGYGRTLNELASLGYRNAVGVDFSSQMIARGRREFPDLTLRVVETLPLAEPKASFDAIFLFAVLTSIPGDDDQDVVLAEVRRLLRPGGFLYISDMPLQSDERNQCRYVEANSRFGAYGVFETDDGAVVRHHDDQRFEELLASFERIAARTVPLTTMNGNPAMAIQILARLLNT